MKMSEVTLSIMELGFLKNTLETALEEFTGIEEADGNLDDYVITTGAIDDCREALALVDSLVDRLRPDQLEDGDGCVVYEDEDEDYESMFTSEELEEDVYFIED